jgi:predicted nucleic acid-binding protein
MSVVLADTGALVALLDRRERFHDWAVEQAKQLNPPLLTCEPVLAEVCFLLGGFSAGRAAIRQNLANGTWRLDFSVAEERERVFALMDAYEDQPMSLADACLVRMSELFAGSSIFTLDSDFRVYRRNRRQFISLIVPGGD